MESDKQPIAVIINGGVATGQFSEGDAVITQLLCQIAATYPLTVFSLVKVNSRKEFPFQMVDIPFHHLQNAWLRLFWLYFTVLRHHWVRPFRLFHGLGGFPAGFLAVILGKILRRKSLVTLLGGEYINLPNIGYGLWKNWHLRPVLTYTLHRSDELVILTATAAAQIQATLPHQKKYHKIPLGIDTSLFVPLFKKLRSPYQFLHVADLNFVKNQPMLLQTFQLISQQVPAHLTIIGTDTLGGKIQQLANDLGISHKITFLPRISHYYLPPYYAQAHILLHTSFSESQTVAVNEALACGTVVCGTNVGLLADLKEEITLVVPVGDVEGLAEKVLHLLRNPELYEARRTKGIAWSTAHNLVAQSEKYTTLYQRMLTA
ncbi:MAG: glycosyltransferase [Spirosomataceae bacterium]